MGVIHGARRENSRRLPACRRKPVKRGDPNGLDVFIHKIHHPEAQTKERPTPGGDGVTSISINSKESEMLEHPDGTYGFHATVTAAIQIKTRERQGDKPSNEEPGFTLRGHENNHKSDLERDLETLNSRIKTMGFTSPQEAQRALEKFRHDLAREVKRMERRTARRDKARI